MEILRNAKLCHGSRVCQLMCSFHHRMEFSPEFSSIRILRDNNTGIISWLIDFTCDGCKNETEPFCVKYCLHGALRKEES